MSSRPDPPDLEGFIDDSFFFDRMPLGARERLVAFYEPFREQVESAMVDDYDPEEQSWRDWRNNYWQWYLPEPPKETMSMPLDEDIRGLERAAIADGGYFLGRLANARLRVGSGLIWLWVARQGPPTNPIGPRNAAEVVVGNLVLGGALSIAESSAEPRVPPVRRGWIEACLDLEEAVFRGPRSTDGRDVDGPFLVDLATRRYANLSRGDGISITQPTASPVAS